MPNLPGGSCARSAEDHEVDLRDRHLVQLDDPDRQTVRQLPLLDCGQIQRRWRARLRRTAAVGRLLRSEPAATRRTQ